MPNLKYVELVRWLETTDLSARLFTPHLLEVVESFNSNMHRIASLAAFPACIVPPARVDQIRRDAAAQRLFGVIGINVEDPDFQAKTAKVEAELNTFSEGFVRGVIRTEPDISDEVWGAKNLEIYAGWDHLIEDGMRALLASIVIGAWTAIETIAGDLWEAAINGHPRVLAELNGSAGRIWLKVQKKTDGSQRKIGGSQPKTSDSKQVSLEDIVAVSDLNLGKVMGTILRKRYDFSIVGKIREAYSAAFCHYSNDIDDALSGTSIDALNLVRNLLVHKNGKADTIYVEGIPGTSAPVLALNETLNLDGEKVIELLGPVIAMTVKLIEAVDRWIKDEDDGKHPTNDSGNAAS